MRFDYPDGVHGVSWRMFEDVRFDYHGVHGGSWSFMEFQGGCLRVRVAYHGEYGVSWSVFEDLQ